MANEIYDSTWWGNTIDTASSIGTSTEMIQGQFNMLTSNQPNLVVNGDFATDSDWNKGSAWSIANGVAISDGTDNNSITQSILLPIGKIRVKFDVTSISQGSVRLFVNRPTFTQLLQVNSIGSYDVDVETSIGANNIYFYSTNNFIGSIDNVSIKQARATTVEASKCLADAIHRIGIQDIQN
jgi:hypothetical protein